MTEHMIERYFNLAKTASAFSDYKGVHIGAVCVYKHKIISVGYNMSKSSPLQMKYNKYRNREGREFDTNIHVNALHAELSCIQSIRSLDIDFSKVSIFVYREHKDGSNAVSKPCRACSKALDDLGIKEWYYTTDNGYAYERRN